MFCELYIRPEQLQNGVLEQHSVEQERMWLSWLLASQLYIALKTSCPPVRHHTISVDFGMHH